MYNLYLNVGVMWSVVDGGLLCLGMGGSGMWGWSECGWMRGCLWVCLFVYLNDVVKWRHVKI